MSEPKGPMGDVASRIPARNVRGADGWGIYLAFVVALAPLAVPIGDYQLAILDAFSAVALAVFAIGVLSRRIEPRAPFLAAAFVIATGSLIAVVIILAVTTMGTNVNTVFQTIANAL